MTPRWPKLTAVRFDDTSRLIPDMYAEKQVFGPLAGSAADVEALTRLAAATNARLQAQEEHHPAGLDRSDMVFGVPYSKIINGAFAYAGEGARFHDSLGPGAWYCATSAETSIREVAFHRVVMLEEIGRRDEVVRYREFLADVHAQEFADLRDSSKRSTACLSPVSYVASQALGRDLRVRGVAGVVYPAVRHPGGTNLAVLLAHVVANVRMSSLWELTIEGGALQGATLVRE